MPANYVHKYSLIFALPGRPAGKQHEYHCLSLESGSGPDGEPGETSESEEGGGSGKSPRPNRKSPASIRDLKKQGATGAGIPASRTERKKDQKEDRKRVKREKAAQETKEFNAELLGLLKNPVESEADRVIIDFVREMKKTNRKKDIRLAKKSIQEDRTLEVTTLHEQIALYKEMGNEGQVKETREKLLALYATPLPQLDMPITAEADTARAAAALAAAGGGAGAAGGANPVFSG
ncbi:unnamed protein product [Ectocarpus sp. CCAP 1310/34]|nr:unnamed protein product [Ectocarpus sp. CCAP 1310/34]